MDERHRVVDEHACSIGDRISEGEGEKRSPDKPVGFAASSRTMSPPSTTSGRSVSFDRIALETQLACPSMRSSTIERPRRRGSRSKSSYIGHANKKESNARQDNCTHCSGKHPARPDGLVPTPAHDPASRVMKNIRM